MSQPSNKSPNSQNQLYQQRQSSRSRSRDREDKRRNSSDKLGRPSKRLAIQKSHSYEQQSYDLQEEQLKAYESALPNDKNRPAFEMMEAIVEFFYEIGHQKGLVFDEPQRREFRNRAHKDPKNNHIEWTERHQWHPDNQAKKLQEVAEDCGMNMQSQESKYLKETLLEVSALCAQQFTRELYKFLLNIWLIGMKLPTYEERKYSQIDASKEGGKKNELKSGKENNTTVYKEINIDSRLRQFADRVQSNYKGWYYCLSFEFKIIKDRNKKSQKELTTQEKQKAYRKLVESISLAFKRM